MSRSIPAFVATAALLVSTALLPTTALTTSADAATPGGGSSGDAYFPAMGSTGYDVGSYDLNLSYAPRARQLSGTATIVLTPQTDLSSFSLDLRDLTVDSVTVDDAPAAFAVDASNGLTITPAQVLLRGTAASIKVSYRGVMRTHTSPSFNSDDPVGWIPRRNGALVLSEPDGAPTWFPVNDDPADKATYRFTVRVPKKYQVVANGEPVGRGTVAKGWRTRTWVESAPMSSYLATVNIGQFTLTSSRATASNVRIINAIDSTMDRDDRRSVHAALKRQKAVLRYFSGKFGPYPFTSSGAIVYGGYDIGYALETQTRPVYQAWVDETTMSHELAHQWFGDSVGVRRWQDVWLNEGFATYAEWLWRAHTSRLTMAGIAASNWRSAPPSMWSTRIGDPGADKLFANSVYIRGALTLYTLRRTIGDQSFDQLLRAWTDTYRHGSASTEDFIALAERISGQDLRGFFDEWLFTSGRPSVHVPL